MDLVETLAVARVRTYTLKHDYAVWHLTPHYSSTSERKTWWPTTICSVVLLTKWLRQRLPSCAEWLETVDITAKTCTERWAATGTTANKRHNTTLPRNFIIRWHRAKLWQLSPKSVALASTPSAVLTTCAETTRLDLAKSYAIRKDNTLDLKHYKNATMADKQRCLSAIGILKS